jgi:hypothetical protein
MDDSVEVFFPSMDEDNCTPLAIKHLRQFFLKDIDEILGACLLHNIIDEPNL